MTLEEAKQKIIDKVLSLKTGWVQHSVDYYTRCSCYCYKHPSLPEDFFVRYEMETNSSDRVSLVKGEELLIRQVGESKLLSHMAIIRKDIDDSLVLKYEKSVISFAEFLSN